MVDDRYKATQTATAACRKLGYSGLFEASSQVGDAGCVSCNAHCTPNDESFCSCAKWIATYDEHMFVSCRSGKVQSFDVRLVHSSVTSEGLLEVGVGGLWATVCLVFATNEAMLRQVSEHTCRQLGYGKGTGTYKFLAGRSVSSPCWYPMCSPSTSLCVFPDMDSILESYMFSLRLDSQRLYGFDISCSNSEWDVRLVNGASETSESEKRVEVFLNKTWSAVCNSRWVSNDSDVVCRQLGYDKTISTERRAQATLSDDKTKRVYTNGARCNRSVKALKECDLSLTKGHGNQSCEETAVACKDKKC